jgi:hypothetical protein
LCRLQAAAAGSPTAAGALPTTRLHHEAAAASARDGVAVELLPIERAADGQAAALQDVRGDHRGFDVFMVEQLLGGADVIAMFEQVGREGVPERVWTDALGDAGGFGRRTDSFLQAAVIGVVAANDARARIDRYAVGREDVLPDPVAGGIGGRTVERIRQRDRAIATGQVRRVPASNRAQVVCDGFHQRLGEHGHTVLSARGGAHQQRTPCAGDVLHPQAQARQPAPATAIAQPGQQRMRAGQAGDHLLHRIPGQDGWQAAVRTGPHGINRTEVPVQHLPIQEQQGGQGLVLGGGGEMVSHR